MTVICFSPLGYFNIQDFCSAWVNVKPLSLKDL